MSLPETCLVCAVLPLLGAFYAFAGFAATRAALTSYFFDWAIAQLGSKKPTQSETLRTGWLLVAAFLVLAGGISLVLQLEIAAWIFVASALGQAFYIAVFAPVFLDGNDPPDPAGRKQTINAFIFYSIVTAGIAWAAKTGHLTSPSNTSWLSIAILVGVITIHLVYVATRLLKLKEKHPEIGSNDGPDTLAGG